MNRTVSSVVSNPRRKVAAKLIVTVGRGADGKLMTLSIWDVKEGAAWPRERIVERGVAWFLDEEEMRMTLNWCLGGRDSKYRYDLLKTKDGSYRGTAYIYD